jgi:alpha/beta superfamily hydrolase
MRGQAKSVGALLAAAALVAGCFSLDPFLYARRKTDAYAFDFEGKDASERVEASRVEPVTLRTADGQTLGAAYVAPAVQPPRAYVVYFHGQCCNLDVHLDRAKQLSNLGYGVLAFDYRGWGVSTGEPSEGGLLLDSRAAVDWLQARSGLPAARLLYYGRSFGTLVATQMAADRAPAALVLESALASVQALVRDSSGGTAMDVGFVAEDAWDSTARLAALPSLRLLLLHGTADDFVRFEFSEQLLAASTSADKRLVPVPGANHNNVPATMGEAWGREIDALVVRGGARP